MSKQKSPGRRSVRAKRLYAHASGRALTRYKLNQNEIERIAKRVRLYLQNEERDAPDIVYLEKQSGTTIKLAVLHGECWLPIVYNKRHRVLVTFLPQEALGTFKPPHQAAADVQLAVRLAGEVIPAMDPAEN